MAKILSKGSGIPGKTVQGTQTQQNGYFVTARGTVSWGVGLFGDRRMTEAEVEAYKADGTVPDLKLAVETEEDNG